MATKKRKSDFAGTGSLVQLIGLALLFFWPLGTIVGVVLFIVGSGMSIKLICSQCGNPIEKTATMCPHCKEPFNGGINQSNFGPSGEAIGPSGEAQPALSEVRRVPCPHCAEMILPAAKICPFCKSELS